MYFSNKLLQKEEIFYLKKCHASYTVHTSIQEVGQEWDALVAEQNFLLSTTYLSSLEQAPPVRMSFCYVKIYAESKDLIGVAYFQIHYFEPDKSLKRTGSLASHLVGEDSKESHCFFHGIHRLVSKYISSKAEFYSVVCGNLLVTGQHGFYFKPHVSQSYALEVLASVARKVRSYVEQSEGIKTSMFLFKDIEEYKKSHALPLIETRYHEFCTQPNMVLYIAPQWASIEDYLNDLQSKYRVRAKSAFKKGSSIEQKNFSVEDIKHYRTKIHQLYTDITDNADFNAVQLPPHYFETLKAGLGNKFNFYAYFHGSELVAFRTSIINLDQLEAHFVGYSSSLNHEYQLYFNILLDYLEEGITQQCKKVIYARTALEIKSSVGAVSENIYCYVRHKRSVINQLLKPLLDRLNPKVEWLPRSPFKGEISQQNLAEVPLSSKA
ncbi:MAG: hypothetical protein EAZ57_04815 [Cytophagales bacterium]|nr:MAG: hypothetical protein EAZ67_01065 [Cytophagales bacterium]TAF61115.1 MAG: hypothetical protein EAZ57_04815 [Cytophagales bacterium]